MQIFQYYYQIFVVLALFSSFIVPKNIIFDFGGVLITTNKRVSFQHIGIFNVATYCFHHRINPLHLDSCLRDKLFTTLDAIAQEHNLCTADFYEVAYDEKGNMLPFLMCAWLQGRISGSKIIVYAKDSIIDHPEWFACLAEQRIIQNMITMIFTPHYLVNSRTISVAGIAFIKKCKHEGHKIYGLSNWDPESYLLLKAKHPELFDLFDGVIISGHAHANKPHKLIYQTLLEQYHLDPEQCWFIDDQEENIVAAQKLGINAVTYKSCFKKLTKEIQSAYSKSVTRRENRKTIGISATKTNTTNNAIIDGENISPTDSTNANCLPAKA